MLSLFLALLLVALAMLVLLWVGTLWGQGFFYDSPTDGIHWRAPAGAGALAAFFLLWMFFERSHPNATDTIFRFTSEQATDFDHFISVRKNEEGREEEVRFDRFQLGSGHIEFHDNKGSNWARSSSGMMVAIIVEDKDPTGGDKPIRHRFDAEMDKDGKFAPRSAGGVNQKLRYLEENGNRFIVEDEPGKVFSRRSGRFYLNLFINGAHFLVWFLVLWLLLRFQWAHALGFAFVCWLAMTLAVVPELLDRSRNAAPKKNPPAQVTLPASR
jgi:hypothetical protein